MIASYLAREMNRKINRERDKYSGGGGLSGNQQHLDHHEREY